MKKNFLNEDLADVKAKVDTNKPLTKADIKQKELEQMKAVQEAALVKAKFRKLRKNRNEITLEKLEQIEPQPPTPNSQMQDDILSVAVFEDDLVKKMSVKEKLKFSKWPKEKREKLVESMTRIKQ